MTTAAYYRQDISNHARQILEPILPGVPGKEGRPAQANCRFIDDVLLALRAGATWRDLPPGYGDGGATHSQFSRWRHNGFWAMLLDAVCGNPDFE